MAQAAQFSLTLQECLQQKDWSQLGLPKQLSFRVALHAGPVFSLKDPITGEPSFTGNHVTRTARMEPLVEPGQIYISEEFAALLHLQTEQTLFKTTYIGTKALPKGGRQLPLYRLTSPLTNTDTLSSRE